MVRKINVWLNHSEIIYYGVVIHHIVNIAKIIAWFIYESIRQAICRCTTWKMIINQEPINHIGCIARNVQISVKIPANDTTTKWVLYCSLQEQISDRISLQINNLFSVPTHGRYTLINNTSPTFMTTRRSDVYIYSHSIAQNRFSTESSSPPNGRPTNGPDVTVFFQSRTTKRCVTTKFLTKFIQICEG